MRWLDGITDLMDVSLSPRETGLILRCAGKAGNPFQTTQGNRLSCRWDEKLLLLLLLSRFGHVQPCATP